MISRTIFRLCRSINMSSKIIGVRSSLPSHVSMTSFTSVSNIPNQFRISRFSTDAASSSSTTPAEQDSSYQGANNTVFVGNLAWAATDETLTEFFSSCGPVSHVRIMKGPDGKPRGFGYVVFETPEAASDALQLSGSEYFGRTVRVDRAVKPVRERSGPNPPSKTLYVGNLDLSVTEDQIREVFQEHGNIPSITISRNRMTGQSKGFAFVTYETIREATAAREALSRFSLAGRPLVVGFAKPLSTKNETKADGTE